MTEQEINQLAEEYAAEFEPMFRKVARRAYVDGMLKAMEYIREKLSEL